MKTNDYLFCGAAGLWVFLFVSMLIERAGGVGLQWDPSPTPGVTYMLYGGKDVSFTNDLANASIRQMCGTNLSVMVDSGNTLTYFVATARNDRGEESAISNMISAGTNAPIFISPPSNLRAVSTHKRKAFLGWDLSPTSWVGQYKIYQGSSSGNYAATYFTSGSNSTYTVTGLSSRKTYWFTVSAIANSGEESVKSNEVSVRVR